MRSAQERKVGYSKAWTEFRHNCEGWVLWGTLVSMRNVRQRKIKCPQQLRKLLIRGGEKKRPQMRLISMVQFQFCFLEVAWELWSVTEYKLRNINIHYFSFLDWAPSRKPPSCNVIAVPRNIFSHLIKTWRHKWQLLHWMSGSLFNVAPQSKAEYRTLKCSAYKSSHGSPRDSGFHGLRTQGNF